MPNTPSERQRGRPLLLLDGVGGALAQLERDDADAEDDEAAGDHQPDDRLLARREEELEQPARRDVVRVRDDDEPRVGDDRLPRQVASFGVSGKNPRSRTRDY